MGAESPTFPVPPRGHNGYGSASLVSEHVPRHAAASRDASSGGASREETLTFDDNHTAIALYGQGEETLRTIERAVGCSLRARGNEIRISGTPAKVASARRILDALYGALEAGRSLQPNDIRQAIRMVEEEPEVDLKSVYSDLLGNVGHRRRIRVKSLAQKEYVDTIRTHDVAFAIGPAGTGKTYLAMAMAIAALNRKEVSRVVLTRPAVEAGERLGFLPGDLAEKVNPYMRPLYDALHDMVDFEKTSRYIERGVIEVAPLAFMRGRTLNDSFVILDEAQNTTSEQMKMFLTRLGFNSKAVITGDVTQVDLPSGTESGLVEATRVLDGVEGIGFMYFGRKDVVRHPLVQSIIEAYEALGRRRSGGSEDPGGR